MTVYAEAAATLKARAEFRATVDLTIFQQWGREDAALADLFDAMDNTEQMIVDPVAQAAYDAALTIRDGRAGS